MGEATPEEGTGPVTRRVPTAWIAMGLACLAIAGAMPGREASRPPEYFGSSSLTPSPARSGTALAATTVTAQEGGQRLAFTVVYDNNPHDPRLRTAWGFACWVETPGGTLLFDTGGDGPTLLGNMARLGLDPRRVDAVMLSHIHGDHTGGLAALLDAGVRPRVYVPAAFPASFKHDIRVRTNLVEVTGPMRVPPGVYTTGEMGSPIVEQALVVKTRHGLVVVTGCAHPGIVEMVARARQVLGGEVALVLGGFHLSGASSSRIESIIADFRRLSVRRVAPCHCTGDRARRMFADAFGADFFPAGVGWSIAFKPSSGSE
jgi:7,8-dihydropterin-6-yl-methyl-4-(beta-D-ribofuranosyl)aminobenzene 5'-phosphate synthase